MIEAATVFLAEQPTINLAGERFQIIVSRTTFTAPKGARRFIPNQAVLRKREDEYTEESESLREEPNSLDRALRSQNLKRASSCFMRQLGGADHIRHKHRLYAIGRSHLQRKHR